tara:strand:+ start:3349 stop:5082 length:1734 start_codon:yes stop_codon:yes gene_type:complete
MVKTVLKKINSLKNYFSNLEIFIICILLLVFISSRLILLGNHFVHYDDLYSPYILKLVNSYDQKNFLDFIERNLFQFDDSVYVYLLNFFKNYDWVFSILKFLLSPFVVGKTSTFAPLQFYLTEIFIFIETNLSNSLFLLRLPSLIFSVLSIITIFLISKKLKTNHYFSLIIPLFVFCFSWMYLVYTAQASSFASIIFCFLCTILIYLHISERNITKRKSILLGFLFTILFLINYQVLFLIPAFYIGLIISFRFSPSAILSNLFYFALVNLSLVLLIYFLFLQERLSWNPGVHWNAGRNQEYLFVGECGYTNLICFIIFFKENILTVLKAILSFTEISSITSNLYLIFLLLLSTTGFFYLLYMKKNIFYFFLLCLITWLFLIYFQKVTLSPSRHSLYLVVIISYLSVYGVIFLSNFNSFVAKIIFNSLLILFLCLYIFNYNQNYYERINHLNFKINLEELILKYDPYIIISTGHSTEFEFSYLSKKYNSKFINESPFYFVYQKKTKESNNTILTFCSSSEECSKVDSFSTINLIYKSLPSKKNIKLIYSYEHESNITNCYSNIVGSGYNSLYLGVWEY